MNSVTVGERDQTRDTMRRTKKEGEDNDEKDTVLVNTTPNTCTGDKDNKWVLVTPKRSQKYRGTTGSTHASNSSNSSSTNRG
jgi:hypothetical protein